MKYSIFETLNLLGLTAKDTRELFNKKVRDKENVNVWRDRNSGVIYIDDFYTGDKTYQSGEYRDEELGGDRGAGLEDFLDTRRRFENSLKFICEKRMMDFGCGNGNFLRLAKPYCQKVLGVELQENAVNSLNKEGIPCERRLENVQNDSIDICTLFHVLEHLPEPLATLSELNKKIVKGGTILIEVPHANDFLLSTLCNENFKQFTLWSQHLVLHTRESLRRMLSYLGFIDIEIQGEQRYSLSNHLNWLSRGEPGGHKSNLALIDTPEVKKSYLNALQSINATDTLVAVAKKP